MYLHLGQNVVVQDKSIIGIFDIDNTTESKITRSYLGAADKSGKIVNITDDIPKSFIVCVEEDGRETIYLSQLSTTTLLRRSQLTPAEW